MTKQSLIESSIEKVTEIINALDDYQSDYDDVFYFAQEYAQQLLDELESIDNSE